MPQDNGFNISSFFDVSTLEGQGISGSDLMNPLSLAQKLGYSFLGTWAIFAVNGDQMVLDAVKGLVQNDMIAEPLSATLVGAGADLLGGEMKRIVGQVTGM